MTQVRTNLSRGWMAMLCLTTWCVAAHGQEPDAISKAQRRGVEFLKTTQSDDGTWNSPKSAGVTALITYALLTADMPVDDPTVERALNKLVSFAQPDGSLCAAGSHISGYETSIVVMALAAANGSGKYSDVIEKATKFLRTIQLDEGESIEESNSNYGGMPYSAQGARADLSNTTFFLEALQASGASSSDPAVQKALAFVSRCQNLKQEGDQTGNTEPSDDGGFRYTAEKKQDGQKDAARSYGSMTYAGFKSLLYAGVSQDDPRITAALDWIGRHYSVMQNPGMGSNGLFYYYYLFAKTLDASGKKLLVDEKGTDHDWREELSSQLLGLQHENGSWVNSKSDRWFEGDPSLVTAYVLVALENCRKK